MDIPTANMRPRPELGGNEVNIKIVERTLGGARTDKQCIAAFETGEWGTWTSMMCTELPSWHSMASITT
jgi:hypothetical protein